MIIWIMFTMAVGVGASLLAGSAEMSFLGSYVTQSPVSAIFDLITVWGEEGMVSATVYTFTNFPELFVAFINALGFNYAVLGQDTMGLVIRIVLIAIVTFPVLFGFFIEVVPRFLPWGRA